MEAKPSPKKPKTGKILRMEDAADKADVGAAKECLNAIHTYIESVIPGPMRFTLQIYLAENPEKGFYFVSNGDQQGVETILKLAGEMSDTVNQLKDE